VEGVAAAWLCFACIVLAVIDKRHFILPDALTWSGLTAGFVFALVRGLDAAMAEAAPSAAAAFPGGAFAEPPLPLASLLGAAVGASMPLVARGVYILGRRRRRASGEDPASVDESMAGGETETGDRDLEVAEAALDEGMGLGDVKMLAMVGAFLGARMALVTILLGSVTGCVVVLPWLAVSGRGFRTPVPFGPFLAAGALVSLFAGDLLVGAYTDLIRRLVF
jgi:prepilin signal peptidase PulO-like enzyme (type II secretory pathway)